MQSRTRHRGHLDAELLFDQHLRAPARFVGRLRKVRARTDVKVQHDLDLLPARRDDRRALRDVRDL